MTKVEMMKHNFVDKVREAIDAYARRLVGWVDTLTPTQIALIVFTVAWFVLALAVIAP